MSDESIGQAIARGLAYAEYADLVWCETSQPDLGQAREFAEEIIALTGSASTIVEKPLPADDPKIRQPDITKARTQLGGEPRVSRTEGLRRTLAYFREALDIPESVSA